MSDGLKLTLSNGLIVPAIQVQPGIDLSNALSTIGLQASRPVLVLVGGASRMSQTDLMRIQNLFVQKLAPLVEDLGGCIVDGGTDAGIMHMIGYARAEISATFPLIGVAPRSLVQADLLNPTLEPLEPHHTHFVFTSGSEWGAESVWLAKIATILAGEAGSTAILINGGSIALLDVKENIAEGRSIVVISGTGRLADEIAAAIHNSEQPPREELIPVLQHKLHLFDLTEPIDRLEKLLRQQLLNK
jgi:hypothetical protein